MIGLWTFKFDEYGLCLYFTENKIFGGSGNYYWTGTYEHTDTAVEGRLQAKRFCGELDPLMNAEEFEVVFKATINGDEMQGTGSPADFPVEFPFTATKRI